MSDWLPALEYIYQHSYDGRGALGCSLSSLAFKFFWGSESRKNYVYGDFMTSPIRVALFGVGVMARYHIRQMLKMQSTTRIVALCEPSEADGA